MTEVVHVPVGPLLLLAWAVMVGVTLQRPGFFKWTILGSCVAALICVAQPAGQLWGAGFATMALMLAAVRMWARRAAGLPLQGPDA